jgi:hypothetical protein
MSKGKVISNKTYKISKACLHCKNRRIKCDSNLQIPCTNCSKFNRDCQTTKDKRCSRPSNEEFNALRARVKQLETYLRDINKFNIINTSIENYTTDNNTNNYDNVNNDNDNKKKYPKPSTFQTLYGSTLMNGNNNNTSNSNNNNEIYGPTSIWHQNINNSLNKEFEYDEIEEDDNFELPIILPTINILNKDIDIIKYIKTFFQWLYPDIHMFIPRETFLIEFYHPREDKTEIYCSIELIYAICAIGSMILENDLKISNKFYYYSKKLLFKNLNKPSITSIQSFLLLSIYDLLYKGNNKSSWLLSGIGLRIGFNIGFHLSPDMDIIKNNKLSVLFKSRIYWGCFIYDHFIGLVLGRPSMLKINDSTIIESDRVPDLEWIKEFNFDQKDDIIDVSNPLKSLIKLIVISENSIRDIFLNNNNNNTDNIDIINSKIDYRIVDEFNCKVKQWKEQLIEELKWEENEGAIKARSMKTPDMIHVYYYYIVLMSVNKNFINKHDNSYVILEESVCHVSAALSCCIGSNGLVDLKRCSSLVLLCAVLVVDIAVNLLRYSHVNQEELLIAHPVYEGLIDGMRVLRGAQLVGVGGLRVQETYLGAEEWLYGACGHIFDPNLARKPPNSGTTPMWEEWPGWGAWEGLEAWEEWMGWIN